MKKMFLIWLISVVITLSAAIYQRTTGPSYPKNYKFSIENIDYKFKLIRSNESDKSAFLKFIIQDTTISGNVYYKKFPTRDTFTIIPLKRENTLLTAELPCQKPAGKLEYYIEFLKNSDVVYSTEKKPVIIRFRGSVPAAVMIPHVFFIFFAMLLSNLAGILALVNHNKQKFYGFLALIFLTIGGMIFGPLVQKYAFGEFWTGIPFGWDLTDNKTLIAFIAWITAAILNFRKPNTKATLIAAIIMIVIFSIPHSLFGSELNPETGEIIQGMIRIRIW